MREGEYLHWNARPCIRKFLKMTNNERTFSRVYEMKKSWRTSFRENRVPWIQEHLIYFVTRKTLIVLSVLFFRFFYSHLLDVRHIIWNDPFWHALYFMLSPRTQFWVACMSVCVCLRWSTCVTCDMRICCSKLHFHNRIFSERSVPILIYISR